jgi:hypothetical protein
MSDKLEYALYLLLISATPLALLVVMQLNFSL